MIPARNILVPTDLTTGSLEALRSAMELKDPTSGEIILLHALHTGPLSSLGAAQKELDARKRIIHLLTTQGMIRRDLRIILGTLSPLASILEAVHRFPVDLIVMATRGYTGLNHALAGSTAEEVVRFSPVPVLVVKIPGQEEARPCENEIQMNLHLN
jgi:nucleotide-binding universal stress UspA family protein